MFKSYHEKALAKANATLAEALHKQAQEAAIGQLIDLGLVRRARDASMADQIWALRWSMENNARLRHTYELVLEQELRALSAAVVRAAVEIVDGQ